MPKVLRHPARRGFTLIEVTVVITVLTVAMGMLSKTIYSMSKLGPVNGETARAIQEARSILEELRSQDFENVFSLYNADPADDPGGVGTAPGSGFVVNGLNVRPGDADGMIGEILFPETGGDLREDVVDVRLGMPRDLNGDSAVDAGDHGGDYELLPVLVRLEWTGVTGDRSLDMYTLLVQ